MLFKDYFRFRVAFIIITPNNAIPYIPPCRTNTWQLISQTIQVCPLQWLRMIDDVGRPVWCLVSSLNNHKLLQFLQHSGAPLVLIFHFITTSHSLKHSRLSLWNGGVKLAMIIRNKVYWTCCYGFFSLGKFSAYIAITSTWSVNSITAFVLSWHQVTFLKVLFD